MRNCTDCFICSKETVEWRCGIFGGRRRIPKRLVKCLNWKQSTVRWKVKARRYRFRFDCGNPGRQGGNVLNTISKSAGNRVTAFMQVRNEADRYLETVLQNLSEFVEDIVIVDDASTDDTVKLLPFISEG